MRVYAGLQKNEYEKAQYEQVLRNIRFYAGNTFNINYAELECLRHNFEPLLKENSVKAIINCLNKLNYINRCIIKKENVNRDKAVIKKAAYFKKEYIISFFLKNLPGIKGAWLAIFTGYWQQRYILLVKRGSRKLFSLNFINRGSKLISR